MFCALKIEIFKCLMQKLIEIVLIAVNQYLHHYLGYKKYKLFDLTKFILDLRMFRLIQQLLSRTRR